jgi:hypothetical protein
MMLHSNGKKCLRSGSIINQHVFIILSRYKVNVNDAIGTGS